MPSGFAKPNRRVIAWIRPDQVDLVRHACAVAALDLAAAGSPARGHSGAIAEQLGCEKIDDLRTALTEGRADAVFIADPGGFGRTAESNDASAIAAAHERGVRILSLEPIPESVQAVSSSPWIAAGPSPAAWSHVRIVGLLRGLRPFRDAMERRADLGTIRSVSIHAWSSPAEGSLAARLVGALDALIHLLGDPEQVDAGYTSPILARGVHALPPETLADLHGDLTANVRFSNGRSAGLAVSNHAGRWGFDVQILAERGRMHVHDHGFEWFGVDGRAEDESRVKRPSRAKAEHEPIPPGAWAIGESLGRLADPHLPDAGPIDVPAVLSIAQTALLSARTGQSENPATIRRLMEPGT